MKTTNEKGTLAMTTSITAHHPLMAKNSRIAALMAECARLRAELLTARSSVVLLKKQLDAAAKDSRQLDNIERILRDQNTYEVFGYDLENEEYHTQDSVLVAASLRELLDLWVCYMDSSPFTVSPT